ncbi:tetratricopeptide repeat protein [delta proteobacterium NaphS2]|nr:tetratricopeptide repeat protein [delta proteobacterium NaphS2]
MGQIHAKSLLLKRLVVLGLALGLTITATLMPMDLFEKKVVALSTPVGDVLEVKEGINGTFSVYRDTEGHLELKSETTGIAGDGDFRIAQKMLGHMGVLLNKNAGDILSIGFGGGETTACLAINNKLNRLDCVEISPEVVQMALKFFKHINLGDELDRKVNMIYMDGKNYLYLTEKRYDIIINGANIPTYSGSAPLFTRDHFQNALEHLNPGGLFISKLHLMSTSKPSFDSILGTFMEVFPHATIWFPTAKPYRFFYLVGSQEKQWICPRFIESQLEKKEIQESISYLNIYHYQDVLSCYVGDKNDIKNYLKEYALNTDYMPYVEFTPIAKNGLSASEFFEFIDSVHNGSVVDHIDWSGMPRDEQGRWQERYGLLHEIWHFQLKILYEEDMLLSLQRLHDFRQLLPKNKALLDLEDDYLSFVKPVSFNNTDRVMMGIDEVLRKRPEFGAGWLVKSWALQAKKDLGGSLIAGKKAVQYSPFTVSAYENLGFIHFEMGQFHEAVSMYRKAIRIKPGKAELYQDLGTVFLMHGQLDNAVSQFSRALKIRPNFVAAHLGLARAMGAKGRNEEAIAHFREVLKINPGNLEAANDLAWVFATYPDAKFRNGPEAVRLAKMVCEATEYKLPLPLDTLAAAYAESGLFDKAQETAKKAGILAKSTGQERLWADIERRLQSYRSKRAFCSPRNPKTEVESTHLSKLKTEEKNRHLWHGSGKKSESRVRISIISVKEQPIAQEILRELKAGGNFSELVRRYSIGPGAEHGGDIGYIAPGDMVEDLRAVAMNLKVGQYSGTVETGNGYFIIMKTDERSSPQTLPEETQEIPGINSK